MSDQSFYLAQAAACGHSAELATLANQREKFLAAQKAWLMLATKVDDMREQRQHQSEIG